MANEEFDAAIRRTAASLDIPFAALAAVVWVESAGRWQANIQGRLEPLIRFEGHYFDRLLPTEKRKLARQHGLANPAAGKIKNPKTQSARWRFLRRAQAIDHDAALESTSWGVGQVMGTNWKMLSYPSVEAMVLDARSGLDGQIRVMTRFILRRNLLEHLRSANFAAFARIYNGPAFAKHGYHTKMERAFRRFGGQNPNAERNWLMTGDTGASVQKLQQGLVRLGLLSRADGDFGPATQQALLNFQNKHGLKADGLAGPETFRVLEFWTEQIEISPNISHKRIAIADLALYPFRPWNKMQKP